MLDDPATIEELLFGDIDDEDAEMPDSELDLDKSWHGIHYLLNLSAWEIGEGAGAAILGGTEIGEDNGYGPARLLDSGTVRAVAAGLGELDTATLRERCNRAAMQGADIYPNIWDEDDVFESYLEPNIEQLRGFYRTAAANGQAVLIALA